MSSPTRIKGNKTQARAIKFLESDGWLVDKVEKTGRFTKQKDLFGLFDLVAVRPDGVLFVQVKTNQPAAQIPIGEFCIFNNQKAVCMTWYDRRGWVFHHYYPDGSIVREDLRK